MKTILMTFAGLAALTTLAGERAILAVNEDNDRYLLQAKPHDLTVEGLTEYLDSVAAGGAVTHFFMCVSGQRTSYGSTVWEPIWKGANEIARNGATNWPWCVNAKILHDRGIDPWKVWCARAREKGVSPWISLRMNDVHFANNPKRICRNEGYWYDHPEWTRNPKAVRDGKTPCHEFAWDYSHPQVREHAMAIVKESLGRWDMDGLELDWMRQCRNLTPGKEREQAGILTAFLREVRRETEAAGRRLGHPVKLGVRVPTTIPVSEALGFDVATWSRERLFDIIVPSPEYSAPDYDMDVPGWMKLVKGGNPEAKVLPCTDIHFSNGRNASFCIFEDPALVRGWALNASGADGHYFFNAPYWEAQPRQALYRGELTGAGIDRLARRFPITYHQSGLTPELKDMQLENAPIGMRRTYRVRVTKSPHDRRARLSLGYNRNDPPPTVKLNGVQLAFPSKLVATTLSPAPKYIRGGWTWDVPASAVSNGLNFVEVTPSKQPACLAVWVEISFAATKENPRRVKPLANDSVTVCASPDRKRVFCYTPGICVPGDGRLVATCDFGGPGAKDLSVPRGKVFVSDDHGKTWRKTADLEFCHARPFLAGGKLYILGHAGDLVCYRSADRGETWTPTSRLTKGEHWHQSACGVWYARDSVYLVMERKAELPDGRPCGWGTNLLMPVLMRAKVTDDLTKRESWTFAESFRFTDIFGGKTDPEFDYFGVPWIESFTKFQYRDQDGKWRTKFPDGVCRRAQPVGWLETNVVQFFDPDHVWYDPSGRTFHLFMRCNTSGSGYAALAKVVEQDDGSMKTMLEQAPSGRKVLFVPFPGGQMRFHVLWDEKTRLYWLLSTQATDTMCRWDRMPKDRYNLPYDERQRLQLSFSRNMVDWCFAGLVATGGSVKESRHYASMAVDGDDLVIVSRSGTKQAQSPHNGDMITFHRVSDFRSLVY